MPEFTTHSEQETRALAKQFVETLHGGELIELVGDLGAGKTTFVRGVVEALGASVRVKSPTFTVMNEYPVAGDHGIKTIAHLDLYRFKTPDELEALELRDYQRPDTAIFVEWPNIFGESVFQDAKRVTFESIDESTRKIAW